MIVRQSTARTILIGPILDSTGAAKTDEVVGSLRITKNGVVSTLNASATLTHDHTGKYKLAYTTSDSDTVGVMQISLNNGTNEMPVVNLIVVEEAIYDRDFAAAATGAVILQTGTGAGQLQIASGQVQVQAGTGSGQLDVASGQVKVQAGTGSGQLDVASGQVKIQPGTGVGQIDLVSGAVKLAAVTHTGAVIPTVSAVSGAVGSVTGAVGSVTAGVTVTTNNDKTGYSLSQAFPTNFSSLAITVGGAVTAGTVSDKTGYSLSQTFPSNFSAMSITAGGVVKADLDTIKTQTVTCAGGVTVPTGTLASTTNITGGIITTASSVTAIATGGITRASFAADTGLQSARSSTAQAGAAGTITLDASASATTDFYKHMRITITGGTGVGQSRICTAYNGTTKVATTTPNWTTTPDATSTFSITDDVSSNLTAISGAAVSTSTAQLGVNVVNWGGTAVASATVRANAIQFAGQTITAAAGVTIPSSIASPTNITAGTITTVTNLTNLPAITTDWLTGTGVAASAVTKIQAGLSTYAGGDTSGTTTLLSRLSSARAGYLDNLNGTLNANLTQIGGANLAGNGASMAAAFDVFFDVITPTLTTASVNQTGDSYPIVNSVTHGNAALKTLIDDVPTTAELATALGAADDATLTAIGALNNVSAADVVAAMGTGSFLTAIPWNAAWDAEVQSEVTDSLTAYDPPTNAELEARTLPTASYFNPATDTVARVTLVDTLTTYTGNTPQSGDAYAVVNDGVHGNAALKTLLDVLDTVVDSILQDTSTDGVALSSAICNKIADHVRRRTQANVEASSDGDALSLRSLYGAIQQGQKFLNSGNTTTVYQTDGTTSLGTILQTKTPGDDPIRGGS